MIKFRMFWAKPHEIPLRLRKISFTIYFTIEIKRFLRLPIPDRIIPDTGRTILTPKGGNT